MVDGMKKKIIKTLNATQRFDDGPWEVKISQSFNFTDMILEESPEAIVFQLEMMKMQIVKEINAKQKQVQDIIDENKKTSKEEQEKVFQYQSDVQNRLMLLVENGYTYRKPKWFGLKSVPTRTYEQGLMAAQKVLSETLRDYLKINDHKQRMNNSNYGKSATIKNK